MGYSYTQHAEARVEYDRVKKAAQFEYHRVTGPALAEYQRVTDAALAKYQGIVSKVTTAPDLLLALLADVAAVIDTTDPEHDDYLDSGADTVQALCELEPRIRAAIAVVKS